MNDPLDTNVADIDISYPRIPANLYELEVSKAEVAPNKANTGQNLNLELKTTSDLTSTTGEPVARGFVISHTLSLTPTGKYTKESVARALATLGQAAGLSCTPRQIFDAPGQLLGKIVRAKVGISKETAEYAERNNIKQFVVVK